MTSTVNYTASRDGYLESEPVHVFTRAELEKAPSSTDEARLHTKIGNAEFLIGQSDTPENVTERFKNYVERTMLTPEAVHGGDQAPYQCPMMYMGYVNALKIGFDTDERARQEEWQDPVHHLSLIHI